MERRLVANMVGYRRAIELIEVLERPHRGAAVEDKLARLSVSFYR